MLEALLLSRRQTALVLFAAGALIALGFAPFHAWPVIFISLPIFYFLLKTASTRTQALTRSFFFGYGYSMAGTWWIAQALLIDADKFAWLLPFSILGLSALMALWFVLLGYLSYRLRAILSPLLFALLWLIVEILRSLGMFGFPWNLAGYIGLASLEFAQLASLIGVYGLSFFIVWLGLLPIYWMVESLHRKRMAVTIVALLLIVASYAFGAQRLLIPPQLTTTKLRLVQPNIPQEVKGTREGIEIATELLERLSAENLDKQSPDITLWPETAYPFTIRPDRMIMLPKFGGVLLTGALRAQGQPPNIRIWNSLIGLSASGEILATYDKHQLVPFGEFVPLRSALRLDKITPGDTDFSRGAGPQTVIIGQLPPFSPQVCYEGIFPWLAIDSAHRPAWMLNVTNDAWYGDTPGPYQHFDMVRMRAIEQGLPMVRVANNGISAVIDSHGRILQKLDLKQRGIIDAPLPAADAATWYSRF